MGKIIRLTERDLTRIVKNIIREQQTSPQGGTGLGMTVSNNNSAETNNQFGPYCKIGQSSGVIKQYATGSSGPNVNMGETGLGLFDNSNNLICKISTKHINGGYVTTKTKK